MSTSYPRKNSIRFPAQAAGNTLTVSVHESLPAQHILMIQCGTSTRILTEQETQEFVCWLTEQLVPQDVQTAFDNLLPELREKLGECSPPFTIERGQEHDWDIVKQHIEGMRLKDDER